MLIYYGEGVVPTRQILRRLKDKKACDSHIFG